MGIQYFLILISLFLVHAQNPCPNSYCDKNAQSVKFPFWIQGQQPENCGLPGFDLTCDAQKRPVLNIPNSGDFYVKSIYYNIRILTLVDPDNCLPMRLMSLNLSSLPFMAASYETYTLFSCPKGQVYSGNVLSCLGNTTKDVLAVSYQEDYMRLVPKCTKIITLQVPVTGFFRVGFPVELDLTWDVSTCKHCGSAIGSTNNRHVLRNVALTLIMLAMVVPALIIGISCCACMTRSENPHQLDESIRASGRLSSSDTVTTAGLDKSTIEACRKITIGGNENRQNEGCAICLTDYVPTDMIMIMHECEHCFHAECIKKWLSINSKCPICRTLQIV